MDHDTKTQDRKVATGNQTRYVKAELSGAGTYMIAVGHVVGGRLDRERFGSAVKMMVERHDALRTRFEIADGTVTAIVNSEAEYELHVLEPQDQAFETFRHQALPLIFDRVDPRTPRSLVRVVVADYGESWRFTIAAHHAITDGFSRGVMNRELLKLYAGEELSPVGSYYDFASAEEEPSQLTSEARKLVDELPSPVRLVGDGVSQGHADDSGQVATRDFVGFGRSLKSLARQSEATRFGILAAAYALAAQGFSGDLGVSSFFQSEGRKALGAPNSIVGPFSNTLPLDLTVDPDRDFASFARSISQRTRQTVAHETEPLLETVLAKGKAPGISINMFPPTSPIRAGDLEIGPREFLDRRTEFDLNLVWAEDRNVLTARAYFDRSTLTESRVGLFLDLLGRILGAAVENPDASCREILRTARSGHEVIMHQTAIEPAPDGRLHVAFFEHAKRQPEAIALITSSGVVSYGDLAKRARAVTAALQKAGVTSEDRVAILAQRDPALVESMLGVSASGASFALIDCTYPIERIQFMFDRLGARHLIAAGTEFPIELAGRGTIVSPDHSGLEEPEIVNGAARQHCCHLFTSGTTGQPRLISHPDTTLLRFVSWQSGMLDLPNGITTMMMAGLAHDPTLRDVFLPLCHGGTVAIPTASEMSRPEALRTLFAEAQCNVVRFSPSTARLLLAGDAKASDFESLKAIFWGGERLPQPSVRTWRELVPPVRQFHVFGTTETPQAFLVHEIKGAPDPAQRDIPIGRPLPWTGARLVDDKGSAVSAGEVGEIVAELADPVDGINSKHTLSDTRSAYQHFTGDLGYQLSDGNIYFAGRTDRQVKVNGFRVELGEIEATTEAIPGIERAYALFSDERVLLFAHYGSEEVNEPKVKATLARRLPSYMMPARIILCDGLPMTQNGKIDHDALVALARDSEEIESREARNGGSPRSEAERAASMVFAKAAGRQAVDRDKSLFDLGADSLSAIEARLELEARGFILPENWEWMPVSELAQHREASLVADEQTGWFRETRRLDTFIVLRSLAIIVVVAHHTGWEFGVGASLVLLTLSGYTFGRLQMPPIVEDGRTGRVWALIAKLLVPLVPASILLFVAHSALGNSPHPATLLLYENVAKFVDTVFLGVQSDRHHIIWLWFLHAYLQIFLLLGILLAFPGLRRGLSADPWRGALLFFGATEVIGAGLILLLSGPLNQGGIVHVSALLQHSPTTLLPFFALGALFALSDTSQRRLTTIILGIGHFAIAQAVYVNNGEVAWLLALGLCAFMPYLTLPRILTSVLVILSGHALMIYLSHRSVYFAMESFAPGLIPAPLEIAVQLAVGALLGIGLRPVLDRLGINRLSTMRISFGARPANQSSENTMSRS